MSEEINHLFKSLDQLSKMLKDAIEKADEASNYANKIGGEFEQELGTDLDSLQELLEDLDSSIEEGETLRDDMESMETGLRSGLGNEENYKIDSEHIQDERQQEREEKERDRE